jgi:hypothetical protein
MKWKRSRLLEGEIHTVDRTASDSLQNDSASTTLRHVSQHDHRLTQGKRYCHGNTDEAP